LSSRLRMTGGQGITLSGRVSSKGERRTTLIDSKNPKDEGGDLYITSAHNTVQDLVLNQLRYGGAAEIQANYTTFQRTTVLGGPKFFVLYFHDHLNGKPAVHNRLLDSTVVSLIDRTVQPIFGTKPCDDAISWAMQDDSLIQNVDFTGTRLALYQDDGVEVDGFTYHPGPQTCDLDGYWITQPSSNVTLENNRFNYIVSLDDDGLNPLFSNFKLIGNVGVLPYAGCTLRGIEWAHNLWRNGACSKSDVSMHGRALPYVDRANGGALDYRLKDAPARWRKAG